MYVINLYIKPAFAHHHKTVPYINPFLPLYLIPLYLPLRRGLAQHHDILQRLGHQLRLVLDEEVRAAGDDHLWVCAWGSGVRGLS